MKEALEMDDGANTVEFYAIVNVKMIKIINFILCIFCHCFQNDKGKYARYNKLLYCSVFYLSAVVSLAFVVGGKLAITILYGEAYLPAVAPLLW